MKFETIPRGLRVLAPAKVNLHLEIGARREDGFHEVDSIFQAVSLYDELEFIRLQGEAPGAAAVTLEESGISAGRDNLVLRAAEALRSACPPQNGGRVLIRLTKRIPQGAGLGGGSSDAAATLLALCRLWQLHPPPDLLHRLATALGSDVPFFLSGGTARCRGRGEVVQAVAAAFAQECASLHFVLAFPGISVNTGEAYRDLAASRHPNFTLTPPTLLDRITAAADGPKIHRDLFFNRFESVVYASLPALSALYSELRELPFSAVLLSGSGSTVYGVCPSRLEALECSRLLAERSNAQRFVVHSVASWNGLGACETEQS